MSSNGISLSSCFIPYFDMDKDTLKFLLNETKINIDEIQTVLNLEPSNETLKKDLIHETNKLNALKLALVSTDDNASLSTVDFSGTLDINKVYGNNRSKFQFNFRRNSK